MSAIVALIWQRISAIFFAVISTPLGAGATVAVLFLAWNGWIDNPRVEREATAGCLGTVEKAALEAQLTEERRRRAAAEAALADYRRQADADAAEAAARAAELEQENAAYEQKLEEQGRRCNLTSDDVEWLLDNGRKARRGG